MQKKNQLKSNRQKSFFSFSCSCSSPSSSSPSFSCLSLFPFAFLHFFQHFCRVCHLMRLQSVAVAFFCFFFFIISFWPFYFTFSFASATWTFSFWGHWLCLRCRQANIVFSQSHFSTDISTQLQPSSPPPRHHCSPKFNPNPKLPAI